jgi:hypothetical protein
MNITDKQRGYLNSIALECAYMKRDFAIGLPGNVSQYMVKKCIDDGLVTKEWRTVSTLSDGRTLSEEIYKLTTEGKNVVEEG